MTDEKLRMLEASIESLRTELHAARASRSARVWDVATKLAVPFVMALSVWVWDMDRASVRASSERHANQVAVDALNRRVDDLPPEWLRAIVDDLKNQNMAILQRLSRVEAQLEVDRGK